MDDSQFDSLAKSLAAPRSRRAMVRLIAATALTGGALGNIRSADAARRGFSGPKIKPREPEAVQCNAPLVYCPIEGACCAGNAACIPPFGCICGTDYTHPCPDLYGYCDPSTNKCVPF